jgi:hypothetical protein
VRYELDPPLTTEQEWMEELGRRTFPNQTRAIAHNEARLKELIEAEEKLSALENMGVDNWEGYSDAMSELREYRASKKEGEK